MACIRLDMAAASTPGLGQLRRWLLRGEWRAHPVRTIVAILAIALGVALGFAIHLINGAAFNEFTAAAKSLSGQADLQVRGTQTFFSESLYPLLARHESVAVASPVLELDASLAEEKKSLKILGIDVLRASNITPDLIGVSEQDRLFDTLADDAIFLSPAALQWLQKNLGDQLHLRSGTRTVKLRIAGLLSAARTGQRIAVMDIGALQWRFNHLGQLSRIDLKLESGVNRAAFKQQLSQQLQGQALVMETRDQETRTGNMSRAYRVNLNVLALVALFTGAFLVFSTQAQAVIRRRSQLALLRVMGLTRRQLVLQLLAEGGLIGLMGALLGLLGGYAIAAAALHFFGGDLGGGYFPGVQPRVYFAPAAALVFFLLGLTVAVLGSASPAWEAARAQPAQALKSGSEDVALARLARPLPALICLAIGALFTQMPPIINLPVFGYLAVALFLIGGIALMPRVTATVFAYLSALAHRHNPNAVTALSLARLANAPNQASIALGGVLSSFSLMVAMAIMVASFRVSVDDWLLQVLPAHLYVQPAGEGDTATLDPKEQSALAAISGVARVDFLRFMQLSMDPSRPAVALIARPIDIGNPGKTLPLIEDSLTLEHIPPDVLPVWVSEAMVDLYAYKPGTRIQLPIKGKLQDAIVAGVWRDYVRQFGAMQMRLSDYRRLTGDLLANNAALWLTSATDTSAVIQAMHDLPFGSALEFSQPGEIRSESLRIFDRSFAVTYLLEAVAIIIGLFGVATTFSGQTLARTKEFGMLRHIGATRRQILTILALEGGLLTTVGIAAGFALGFVISLILVFIVNPQSFHWSMQLHMPWALLLNVAAVLLASSTLTAIVAGRYAISGNAIRSVREDW
jgi:putative ABC transport system permease protein